MTKWIFVWCSGQNKIVDSWQPKSQEEEDAKVEEFSKQYSDCYVYIDWK